MLKRIQHLLGFIGLSALIAIPGLFEAHNAIAASSTSIMDNLKTVASSSYDKTTDETTILTTVAGIIKIVLSLLGFIFVVLIIYSGILWMTAGGNEKQVERAKNIIKNAFIGLTLVILAYAVTYFIFASLPGGGTTAAG